MPPCFFFICECAHRALVTLRRTPGLMLGPPKTTVAVARFGVATFCAMLVFFLRPVRCDEASVDEKIIETRAEFDPEAGFVHVPVTMNGTSRQFVVDTGASMSGVDLSLRMELGLPLRTVEVSTALGTRSLELFKAPACKLGDRVLSGVTELVGIDMSVARDASATPVVGIVGMDFLWQRIVRFDFDRGELMCLRAVPEGSGTPIPLRRAERGPEVMLDVDGVGALPFLVDTGWGSHGAIEASPFAALLRGANATYVTTAPVESAGRVSSSRAALVSSIALGSFRHRDLLFSEGEMNILGLGYLSRYIVTFDFAGKRMYLRPGKGYSRPSRWNLSGSHFLRKDGRIVVSRVLPGCAAERAGLRVDDVIEAVDSLATHGLTLWDVCKPLREPGKHTLRIVRGTETIDLSLILERPKTAATAPPAATDGDRQTRRK